MFLLCLLVSCMLLYSSQAQPVCAPKFSLFNVNHTACLHPPTGALLPVREGITPSNRKYILDLHNYHRSTVHRNANQPEAANMQKMYWDEELAMIAQKWASNCIWDHDGSSKRSVPGKYSVGQNLARGHRGWGAVIRHWQSEVSYLSFGKGKTQHNQPIGHYTQMVWAGTSRLGCGYARCNRTEPFYVCNYAPSGNKVKSRYSPYKAGTKTADCPNTKTSGLCDCKGKVCFNGGSLDLATCQCKCLNKPWIQQNGACSLDCSKAEDSFACASNGGRWGQEACGRYANVPYEYCPLTCNLCTNRAMMTTPSPQPHVPPSHTTLPLSLFTTGVNPAASQVTQVMADHQNGSAVNHNPERVTPKVDIEVTSTASSSSTSIATTSQPQADLGLPECDIAAEIAKCGQPNARGYYNPKYCPLGLDHYCPAMCGKCTVSACMDYDNNEYSIGDAWMNEYGEMTCTTSGVQVRRGCYVEKSATVISELEEHSYTDRNINWLCVCNIGYSLSCKGVWSPSGKVRH
ncbi:cysteine-rich venom protein Mr30-like [Watersipora subatra]|uniref:cysteine-rich venom protein Mr30-like n=1 Tax=Watersipora subatra TaxID=2589382 RepID=UPI00355BBC15